MVSSYSVVRWRLQSGGKVAEPARGSKGAALVWLPALIPQESSFRVRPCFVATRPLSGRAGIGRGRFFNYACCLKLAGRQCHPPVSLRAALSRQALPRFQGVSPFLLGPNLRYSEIRRMPYGLRLAPKLSGLRQELQGASERHSLILPPRRFWFFSSSALSHSLFIKIFNDDIFFFFVLVLHPRHRTFVTRVLFTLISTTKEPVTPLTRLLTVKVGHVPGFIHLTNDYQQQTLHFLITFIHHHEELRRRCRRRCYRRWG